MTAAEVVMAGGIPELGYGLDEHEFSVIRKGYDPEEVKAYLAEIELSLRQLEDWAVRMRARLAILEEKSEAIDDVDAAMVAVFETRERVLERAQMNAQRIEAEAVERGRADAVSVAAEIIAEAHDEALRSAETAAAATEPATDQSSLEPARAGADGLLQDTQTEFEPRIEDARTEANLVQDTQPATQPRLPVPEAVDRSVGSEIVAQLLGDMEGDRFELEALPVEESAADEGDAEALYSFHYEGDEPTKRSRYQRASAGLPTIGDATSEVRDSIQRLRKRLPES